MLEDEDAKTKPHNVILDNLMSLITVLQHTKFAANISMTRVYSEFKHKAEEFSETIERIGEKITIDGKESYRIQNPDDAKKIAHFSKQLSKLQVSIEVIPNALFVHLLSTFDAFFAQLLFDVINRKSHILNSRDRKIDYAEVLKYTSFDELKNDLISKEVDKIMRDSHKRQIAFLSDAVDINFEAKLPHYDDFLELCERRNVIVHNRSKVNSIYIKNTKELKTPHKLVKENEAIEITGKYFSFAADLICQIAMQTTLATLKQTYRTKDEADDIETILLESTFEFLKEGKKKLPKHILEYFISEKAWFRIPGTEISCIINYCIALKRIEKRSNVEAIVERQKFEIMEDKYKIARHCLLDEFEKAIEIIKANASVFQKDAYKTWPIFEDLRKQDLFREWFSSQFGESIDEETVDKRISPLKTQSNDQQIDSATDNQANENSKSTVDTDEHYP